MKFDADDAAEATFITLAVICGFILASMVVALCIQFPWVIIPVALVPATWLLVYYLVYRSRKHV